MKVRKVLLIAASAVLIALIILRVLKNDQRGGGAGLSMQTERGVGIEEASTPEAAISTPPVMRPGSISVASNTPEVSPQKVALNPAQEARVQESVQALRGVMERIEASNTTKVFSADSPNAHRVVLALHQPSIDQYNEFATAAAQLLKTLPDEASIKETQRRFAPVYTDFTNFKAPYRGLSVDVKDDSNVVNFVVFDAANLEDVTPRPDGSTTVRGTVKILSDEAHNSERWKQRYGHLLSIDEITK